MELGGSKKPTCLGRTPILCSQAVLCGTPVTSINRENSTILHLAGPGFFSSITRATETYLKRGEGTSLSLSIRRRQPFCLPSQEDM